MQDGITTTKADVVVEKIGKGKARITATFTFHFVDRIREDVVGKFTRVVNPDEPWGTELIAMTVDNPTGLAKTSGWTEVS
jgi:hypothetical protein